MGESYSQAYELRSIDRVYNVLQIFAESCERKTGERGEESARGWRCMSSFPFRARSRQFEPKREKFEPCQRGDASDHRLGRKEPGIGDAIKFDMDEVSGGQE